jgi:hypothetical protein
MRLSWSSSATIYSALVFRSGIEFEEILLWLRDEDNRAVVDDVDTWQIRGPGHLSNICTLRKGFFLPGFVIGNLDRLQALSCSHPNERFK